MWGWFVVGQGVAGARGEVAHGPRKRIQPSRLGNGALPLGWGGSNMGQDVQSVKCDSPQAAGLVLEPLALKHQRGAELGGQSWGSFGCMDSFSPVRKTPIITSTQQLHPK